MWSNIKHRRKNLKIPVGQEMKVSAREIFLFMDRKGHLVRRLSSFFVHGQEGLSMDLEVWQLFSAQFGGFHLVRLTCPRCYHHFPPASYKIPSSLSSWSNFHPSRPHFSLLPMTWDFLEAQLLSCNLRSYNPGFPVPGTRQAIEEERPWSHKALKVFSNANTSYKRKSGHYLMTMWWNVDEGVH